MNKNDTLEDKNIPQLHTIVDPKSCQNQPSETGAAAFSGKLNHANSRYYVFNDYYNMESDETLHILSHFKTYQQTTEYTCGAASALMILNRFVQKQYHEKAVAGLLACCERFLCRKVSFLSAAFCCGMAEMTIWRHLWQISKS